MKEVGTLGKLTLPLFCPFFWSRDNKKVILTQVKAERTRQETRDTNFCGRSSDVQKGDMECYCARVERFYSEIMHYQSWYTLALPSRSCVNSQEVHKLSCEIKMVKDNLCQ